MNIILIGTAGSGKDEFFRCLQNCDQRFKRYAFGDPIRLVARNLRINGVEPAYSQLYQLFQMNPPPNLLRKLKELREIPKTDEKDRRLLQELGTYCREYDDYIWLRDIRETAQHKDYMCITDCRRKTELESFPDFISIYIDAPYAVRIERLRQRDRSVDELALKHKAEQEIELLKPMCNFTITNDGTLDELKVQLEEILSYSQQYKEGVCSNKG